MLPSHWKDFGSWIRIQRKLADLTQDQLAKKAGIHAVQLARIEKGESGTRRETVLALAKALGQDQDELLNKAGFVQTSGVMLMDKNGAVTSVIPKRKKPESLPELLSALDELGIEIDWATLKNGFENYTPDDFEELKEQIAANVGIKIKRVTSR